MILEIPTKAEAKELLKNMNVFRDYEIVKEALPPEFIIKEAVKKDSSDWIMPRLYVLKEEKKVIGSAVSNLSQLKIGLKWGMVSPPIIEKRDMQPLVFNR